MRRLENKLDTVLRAVNNVGTDVTALKSRVEALPNAEQFGAIRHDLGRLDGHLSQLPTWKAMVTIILILGAVTGGLAAAIAEFTRASLVLWNQPESAAVSEPAAESQSRPVPSVRGQ